MPTPDDGLNFMPFEVSVAYFAESEKYDSSAVTRLRRSDFIAAMYAFDLVLANFGIAMAARIPMITTTIRSSMRVKPRRFRRMVFRECKWTLWEGESVGADARRRTSSPPT